MNRRTAYWLVGGAVVGTAVVAVVASSGPPKNPIEKIEGLPTGLGQSVAAYYSKMRAEVGWGESAKLLPTHAAQAQWAVQKNEFDRRISRARDYALAHPELTGVGNDGVRGKFGPAPDQFSKQSFLVYRPENTLGHVVDGRIQFGATYGKYPVPWGWHLTDEFGRPFEGWGKGGSGFGAVLILAQAALPLIPGIGTAGGAALGAAIAIGQGKSLKEIGLASARGALPPGAQLAFDAGVGVAQGKSVDDAAFDAALTALDAKYPGSKAAFAKGKALAK